MAARVTTVAFQGIDVRPVDVQVQIAGGLPAFTIVGLPDKAVAESRERVRAALHALGIALPAKRIIINLAPADLAKEGSHFDLPIALALLSAMQILPEDALQDTLALGELSLNADVLTVAGVLPSAIYAQGHNYRLICPASCGREAVWAGEDMEVLAPASLLQLINHVKGTQLLTQPQALLSDPANENRPVTDLAHVKGQETAKRALEIAAAGGHNLLMSGPPGSGKSMLASCLPGILPPLSPAEALEVSMIHSLAATLPEGGLLRQRPYRDPHHSASLPALIGGGQKAKPGEIALAHRGVLFLDELPEFARGTLEALRQPLETGQALVARVNMHVTYPARFQLIAAMNPCRCGYLGDPERECTRAPRCAVDYQAKISGPLLDRIDLKVDVPPVSYKDLSAQAGGETSAQVAARVQAARTLQKARQGGDVLNAHLGSEALLAQALLAPTAQALLDRAAESLKLSARGYHRLLRVARTIADLAGHEGEIDKPHMAEALSYRQIRFT